MKALIARWQALAPREQWLVYGVGLALLAALYFSLLADPLAARRARDQAARAEAEQRALRAEDQLAALQARLGEDPNQPYRQALQAARAEQQALQQQIDQRTAALIGPAAMKALLQDLLSRQPALELIELKSFSEPLQVAAAAPATPGQPAVVTPPALYRHGVRLTLAGGYFDLMRYLQAIQQSGWHLHWNALDYQVDTAVDGRARIHLELQTLSRDPAWVGV